MSCRHVSELIATHDTGEIEAHAFEWSGDRRILLRVTKRAPYDGAEPMWCLAFGDEDLLVTDVYIDGVHVW